MNKNDETMNNDGGDVFEEKARLTEENLRKND
jgi:hypothetical protein